MKRYELKKNLPTSKAGEIFYLSDMGNLIRESDNVLAYNWSTIDKFPNILTDWFEEIKEPTRWKPELGQKYYFLDSDGFVYNNIWADDSVDHGRLKIGNCFQTKEEAERAVEYLKALAVVRGDATTKFVNGEYNWYVYFDIESGLLLLDTTSYSILNGIFGLPYFATKEDALRSIKQHKNEWLTIFGVKEKLCD